MKVGSLFSGIGGFDLGLERAGFEVVWQAEREPFCNRVLAAHWPEVKRYGDVRDIGLGRLQSSGEQDGLSHSRGGANAAQRCDLICGGFPCQDLSVAGKRAGLDGERSGLWFEFKRILQELRPSWALIENVPGLLSSNQGRDFAVVLDGLGECGFGGIAWAVLDSQHFGVPQRRRRVYVVAGPSRRSVEQVLSLCESCGGHPQTSRAQRQDFAGPLGGGAYGTGRRDEDDPNLVLANTLPGHHPRHDLDHDTYVAHSLRADGFDASEDGTGRGTPLVFDETQITSVGNYSNPQPGDNCHPLAAGARPPTIAGSAVRRLTPVECERLQGFPDGWTDIGNAADGPRYKALGNAVSVPVIEYLGLRIKAVSPPPAASDELTAKEIRRGGGAAE